MTKKTIFMSLFVLTCSLLFLFIACDTGSKGGQFESDLQNTTWKYSGTTQDKLLVFASSENTVTFSEIRGGSMSFSGTYTQDGNNISFHFTGVPFYGWFDATGTISNDSTYMDVKTPYTSQEKFVKQP